MPIHTKKEKAKNRAANAARKPKMTAADRKKTKAAKPQIKKASK
jgi:hypothetical protein